MSEVQMSETKDEVVTETHSYKVECKPSIFSISIEYRNGRCSIGHLYKIWGLERANTQMALLSDKEVIALRDLLGEVVKQEGWEVSDAIHLDAA